MKNKILILLPLLLCLLLSGCNRVDGYEVNWGMDSEGYLVSEWVSPDGVHYWHLSGGALAPRYNSKGELVIDDERSKLQRDE